MGKLLQRSWPALILLGVIAVAWLVVSGALFPPAAVESEDRLSRLRAEAARRADALADAVRGYRPAQRVAIDDLTAAADALLRQLPGVAAVERRVAVERPARRIIHVADRPYVPKGRFVQHVRTMLGREPTAGEIDDGYEGFLLQVELVQAEQIALLRCLARHHGLTEVWTETPTTKEIPEYDNFLDALKAAEKDLAPLREKRSEGSAPQAQREASLQLGAVGVLLLSRELRAAPSLEAVAPEPKHDSGSRAARRDDWVRRLVEGQSRVAVIVLDGEQDLSASIGKIAGSRTEYLRVVTKSYIP